MKKVMALFVLFTTVSAFGSLPYNIELILGDSSCDGHCIKERVTVKSNLPRQEVEVAYSKAVDILGFNLVADVADEFEDSTIPLKYIAILLKAGVKVDLDDFESLDQDEAPYINVREFAKLFLEIVKLGNSSFEYEITFGDNEIDIGGYGLFNI